MRVVRQLSYEARKRAATVVRHAEVARTRRRACGVKLARAPTQPPPRLRPAPLHALRSVARSSRCAARCRCGGEQRRCAMSSRGERACTPGAALRELPRRPPAPGSGARCAAAWRQGAPRAASSH